MSAYDSSRRATWYKDAVIYELHVRAFCDGNADGVGDFPGLISKLDYLRDLGVTTLWLLPFYPSPLKDDGYDIADYENVHPAYGTLRDFRRFLDEAHRRGLRVITELVLNHTSDQHAWFQRARQAPAGSEARNFYVWSEAPGRYEGARIIFRDFEPSNWTWDPVARAYYWHRFFSHQPDLNFDSPAVRVAILQAVDFWLELGVDGLRLDAVPYLYEAEGTPSENLPLTHAFLKELRARVDARFPDRVLVAEANQWPEDAAAYFGAGDECQMAFHFPLMPRLYLAIHGEDRLPIVDIVAQTPPIPETCQWVLFLRNHDELTLEMVSDAERLSLYRAFAPEPESRINLGIRRRLAPLLGNDRRQIELLNALLFSLPGTPVIYYGDEIGMGDNIYLGDRNSVRTPMQWSADRNAGFSRADPQRLYLPLIVDHEFHHEAIQVEAQSRNQHSLLNWMRKLVALRSRHPALGRGDFQILRPANHRVLAFLRMYEHEQLLIVANLSRFVQHVELDLQLFGGSVPVELFGHTPFWPIGDEPYRLTLGPHGFFWFSLNREGEVTPAGHAGQRPRPLQINRSWPGLLLDAEDALGEALLRYLQTHRWFSARGRTAMSAHIVEAVDMPKDAGNCAIAFVRVGYTEGEPETYVLPLAFLEEAGSARVGAADTLIARVSSTDEEPAAGAIAEATSLTTFQTSLLTTIGNRRKPLKGTFGELVASREPGYQRIAAPAPTSLEPLVDSVERAETAVVVDGRLIVKLLRRVEAGTHPEVEIGRVLTAQGFSHASPYLGALEYRPRHGEPMTVAELHGYLPNQGTAWRRALMAIRTLRDSPPEPAMPAPAASPAPDAATLLELAERHGSASAGAKAGDFGELAHRLGERTAELHMALASDTGPDFAPEPMTPFAQRSLYQAIRGLTGRVFRGLRSGRIALPEPLRQDADELLGREAELLARFRRLIERRIAATMTRGHGDLHLSNALVADDDVVFSGFEGDPDLPLAERRLKQSPLRDVAGMLRSFACVAEVERLAARESGVVPGVVADPDVDFRIQQWRLAASTAFLRAYLDAVDPRLLPPAREDLMLLLETFLLEKAIVHLGYELRNRPARVEIPLRGLNYLLTPRR